MSRKVFRLLLFALVVAVPLSAATTVPVDTGTGPARLWTAADNCGWDLHGLVAPLGRPDIWGEMYGLSRETAHPPGTWPAAVSEVGYSVPSTHHGFGERCLLSAGCGDGPSGEGATDVLEEMPGKATADEDAGNNPLNTLISLSLNTVVSQSSLVQSGQCGTATNSSPIPDSHHPFSPTNSGVITLVIFKGKAASNSIKKNDFTTLENGTLASKGWLPFMFSAT